MTADTKTVSPPSDKPATAWYGLPAGTPGTERDPAEERFHLLMDPSHELRRDEIVWILSYVKQKAADEDPALLGLHQPRLLKNFVHYAEIALLLIQSRSANVQEYGHIRHLLAEACHGLLSTAGQRQG